MFKTWLETNEKEILYRDCESQDIAQVVALANASLKSKQEPHYFERLCNGRNPFIVATWQGKVVGYAAARLQFKDKQQFSNFTTMAVSPEMRGRGIGRALTAKLIERSEKIGTAYMRGDVRDGNDHARALYGKLGFKEEPYGTFKDGEGKFRIRKDFSNQPQDWSM
tara:strand:+ start:8663 stop:9160 length:498 start_codon:yes stop_codon:yes gene_type:complete